MDKTSGGPLTWRVEGNVGHITLNRPDRLNAFDLELANQFLAALERFRNDGGVRVVVLRGAGRVFSAGGDVHEMWGAIAFTLLVGQLQPERISLRRRVSIACGTTPYAGARGGTDDGEASSVRQLRSEGAGG